MQKIFVLYTLLSGVCLAAISQQKLQIKHMTKENFPKIKLSEKEYVEEKVSIQDAALLRHNLEDPFQTNGELLRVIWRPNPILLVKRSDGRKMKFWCYAECDPIIYSFDTKKFIGKKISIDWKKSYVETKHTKRRFYKRETTKVSFR